MLLAGTPGGSTIITTVFQMILNTVDYDLDIAEAIAARRVHHQWKPRPLRYEPGALSPEVQAALRGYGWALRRDGPWGRAAGIRVRYGDGGQRTYFGAFDPRGDGAAVGY